eukprot:1158491-Pelagomonas_calceolata.AAC.7
MRLRLGALAQHVAVSNTNDAAVDVCVLALWPSFCVLCLQIRGCRTYTVTIGQGRCRHRDVVSLLAVCVCVCARVCMKRQGGGKGRGR